MTFFDFLDKHWSLFEMLAITWAIHRLACAWYVIMRLTK